MVNRSQRHIHQLFSGRTVDGYLCLSLTVVVDIPTVIRCVQLDLCLPAPEAGIHLDAVERPRFVHQPVVACVEFLHIKVQSAGTYREIPCRIHVNTHGTCQQKPEACTGSYHQSLNTLA